MTDQTNSADRVGEILDQMRDTFARKNADYASSADPWANFRDSSRQVNATPGTSVEVLIGVKQARLRQLLRPGKTPANESVRDTLLDRAVYAVIALAMYDEGLYSEEPS